MGGIIGVVLERPRTRQPESGAPGRGDNPYEVQRGRVDPKGGGVIRIGFFLVAIASSCAGALTAQESGREAAAFASARTDTLHLSREVAVARAVRESEEMAAARATLAQAEAQVIQATSGALPQITSSLTYVRAIKTIFDDAADIPGIDRSEIPPAFDLSRPPEDRFDDLSSLLAQDFMGALFRGLPFGRKNTYLASLTLVQPLYVGGKLGAARNVARHFREAARDQVKETEAEIALQVRAAYLMAALAQRLHGIALESQRVAFQHLTQVQSFHDAGTASEFDLLRARVDSENRDPLVVQAENGATVALLDLKRLANIPASQPILLTTHLDPTLDPVDEEEIRVSLQSRPALDAAQKAVMMREEAVRIAKGDMRPTVTFLANMGFQTFPEDITPPGFDEWRKDWNVALSVSLPLFDGFRTRGKVDQARADLNLAQLDEIQLQEGLGLQLEAAFAKYRTARAQVLARRETAGLAGRTLELAEVRFASGLSTQLEVSDAALLFDQANVNEVQALYDYVRALAVLERLSGGTMNLMEESGS